MFVLMYQYTEQNFNMSALKPNNFNQPTVLTPVNIENIEF